MCGNLQAFSLIFTGIFFVVVPHLAHSCLPKSNCWGVSVSLKLHKQTLGQKPSVNRSCGGGIWFSHGRLKARSPNRDTTPSLCHPRQGLTATHNPTRIAHSPFAWHERCWCLENQTALQFLPTNKLAFSAVTVLLLTCKGKEIGKHSGPLPFECYRALLQLAIHISAGWCRFTQLSICASPPLGHISPACHLAALLARHAQPQCLETQAETSPAPSQHSSLSGGCTCCRWDFIPAQHTSRSLPIPQPSPWTTHLPTDQPQGTSGASE